MARGKKDEAQAAGGGDDSARTADTVAAGAIEGAQAVAEAGGDAHEVAVGAIGGAAAGTAEAEEEARASAEEEAPATEPAEPASEGEDHITQFEKRCERLIGIVEDAEFESGTLVGDIRDTMLEIFKNRPK